MIKSTWLKCEKVQLHISLPTYEKPTTSLRWNKMRGQTFEKIILMFHFIVHHCHPKKNVMHVLFTLNFHTL
jgi:hypothetical protein